ncbi:MAG TPA: hypothetical protein DCQ53_01850, partial [Alphaproteobacteria bacterium]|nr:hypothetical protein [Alphaproteobacteria bacterium]
KQAVDVCSGPICAVPIEYVESDARPAFYHSIQQRRACRLTESQELRPEKVQIFEVKVFSPFIEQNEAGFEPYTFLSR